MSWYGTKEHKPTGRTLKRGTLVQVVEPNYSTLPTYGTLLSSETPEGVYRVVTVEVANGTRTRTEGYPYLWDGIVPRV